MDKKAVKGILIGYDNNDGYSIWRKENNTLIRSRDVIFEEKTLGLKQDKAISLTPKPSDTIGVQEIEVETESEPESQEPMYNLRCCEDVKKPKRLHDYIMLAESSMGDISDPEQFKEAINCDWIEEWKKAMDLKMQSNEETHNCTLENLSK